MKLSVWILLFVLACQAANVLAEEKRPLMVFILAGQSNMQGHAQVRTLEHVSMDPSTSEMLSDMQASDGMPRVCERVWISCIGCADHELTGKLTAGFGAAGGGPKIGPEFTFGLRMQKYYDGPILLIKTAWGGRSLHTDFRPPSAGPYQFSESQLAKFKQQNKDLSAIQAEKLAATGQSYREMVEHVRAVLNDIRRVVPDYDPGQGYKLAGMVWFQGWNDMVDSDTYPQRDQPGGYQTYSENLTSLINDVRRDLQAPKLPFVIGVMGVGGPVAEYDASEKRYAATHQNFRNAMAAPAKMPEFRGNVTAVLTENCWDRELSTLKAKENAIRQTAKQAAAGQQLKPAEERALFEKLREEQLTTQQRRLLEVGISNLEFHYLGSAKILGCIGYAFADAAAELNDLRAK